MLSMSKPKRDLPPKALTPMLDGSNHLQNHRLLLMKRSDICAKFNLKLPEAGVTEKEDRVSRQTYPPKPRARAVGSLFNHCNTNRTRLTMQFVEK